MAGRPKTMAKKMAALEERAFQLVVDLCAMRPAQYRERQGREDQDPMSQWWNESVRAVSMGSIAVAILLARLEEHAGLDWESLERQREQQRGLLVPCEEPEDKGTEEGDGQDESGRPS